MTETKRDVFLQIAKENRDLRMYDPDAIEPKELIEQDYQDWIREYDAALPDDLPVITELISKYLIMRKRDRGDLVQALDEGTSFLLDGTQWESVQDWFWFSDVKDRVDTFARAWVLGVWRVEETGEIVKLEAEK